MNKAKIQIVEDEAIIAMEIESQLQSLGYEITSIVDTGVKAIKKAEEDKPDIILMDIRIKGDIDGIDTAEAIRSQFGIPVIFSTAYLDEERIQRAKITMPFGYVLKPIQERDLKVTLEMALYISKVDNERKQTAIALSESEKRHRELHHNLIAGVVVHAPDTSILLSNPKASEILGLSDEQMRGKEAIDPQWLFVYEDGKPVPLDKYPVNHVVSTKHDLHNMVMGINRPQTNDFVWVLVNGHPLLDADEKIEEVIITFIDITELIQTRKSLEKREKWFSTTLNSIGDAVITTDTKGNVTMLNPVAESLTGWNQKEVTGKPLKEIFNIINENTREQVENPVEKVLREGKIVGLANHTFLIAKDGKEIPIDDSASPIRDSSGEIIGVVLVFHDIIERKQAEAELKQNEKKYRTLFENSPYGVFLVDNNAKYIEVNDAACEMTGYSKEELLCLSIPEISAPDDEARNQDMKPFLDIQSTGKGEGIIHLKHKDGSIFKANLKGVKIDNDSVVGICEKLKD